MKRTIWSVLSLSLLALLVDLLTKAWAGQVLVLSHPVSIIGESVRLTLGYNTGVAFSVLAAQGSWLVGPLTGIIIVALSLWCVMQFQRQRLPQAAAWPIGLILGGALGNFVDRLPDGRVTDMIDLGVGTTRFATFNLADTCITLGVIWLLIVLAFRSHREEESV